jgi:hypothetical protein
MKRSKGSPGPKRGGMVGSLSRLFDLLYSQPDMAKGVTDNDEKIIMDANNRTY